MRTIRKKIALVTGAGSGIGRAIALRLAQEGADLFLIDIAEKELAATVAAAKSRGACAVGRYCDVSQQPQISACTRAVIDRWGGVDILVNNAGITYYGDTAEMSIEHCERLLAINLHAPIQFTCELLPSMLEREEAHVLNVASFFGLIGSRKLAAYTSSKFGLVGFSESLRAEYGRRGLGVTALCPGFVDTNLFATAPRGKDLSENKIPPGWLLTTPEKIAKRAIKAIYRNQALVVQQPYAKLAHFGKRFFPSVIDWAHHASRRRKKRAVPELPEASTTRHRAA
ncbi:MAG: SDR family oxidoreductase [Planctomycetales bacterium]|nr:SDR family oxidoreductase [Planctomycetales bacterium]